MISQQQRRLIGNLVSSDTFSELIDEIKRDMFIDWSGESALQKRENLYYEALALDRIIDVLTAKAHEMTSGDTNA